VGVISRNRPAAAYALDIAGGHTLIEAVVDVESDQRVRTVLLTGAGGFFCSSGDLAATAKCRLSG
jgi:enoyl-CoA hydratase/carnithine racemase